MQPKKAINQKAISTYQTRIVCDRLSSDTLQDVAGYLSLIERKLYADFMRGLIIIKQKTNYIKKYKISSRQFNAIRVNLEGKIDSILALNKTYASDAENKIKRLNKAIQSKTDFINKERKKEKPKHDQIAKAKNARHQKKRLLHRTEGKLASLIEVSKSKKPSICFGSKALFNAQHHLKENKYLSHDAWLTDWKSSRNNQFYVLGSKDETSGNQGCSATLNENGSFKLRVLIPEHLRKTPNTKYLVLDNVKFHYGQDEITNVLSENETRKPFKAELKAEINQNNTNLIKNGFAGPPAPESRINPNQYYPGRALSYRFIKDAKGWRVFVSLERSNQQKIRSSNSDGCFGIDINEHHLSVTEINRHGNFIRTFDVPCCTYGKSTDQSKAIIGDACKLITEEATKSQKPLVIEDLDFSKKKQLLAAESARYSRMISSFSYNKIKETLKSQAIKKSISVYAVSPAYTSLIGRFKFGSRLRLSVHQGAALAIARRLHDLDESMPQCLKTDIKGSHYTAVRPVKDRHAHGWSHWAKLHRVFREAAHAVHHQKVPVAFYKVLESMPF